MTADEIQRMLGLEPLPTEGGFYAEMYRAGDRIPAAALHRHPGERAFSTAIYYMLTSETFSAMHRVRSDELFHFYMGDAVEMLQLTAGGSGRVVRIGTDLAAGERPQVLVPAGTWQGARLVEGGSVALLGTTVSPGFEFEDYEHGDRDALVESHPQFEEMIRALTR